MKNQKTIIEWYDHLREPWRSRARENVLPKQAHKKVNDLSEALFYGFIWSKTPEGQNYWANIHHHQTRYEHCIEP